MRTSKFFTGLLLGLSLMGGPSLHADGAPKEIQLFDKAGEPVWNYDEIVKLWPRQRTFKPPLRLHFGDEGSFTVFSILGEGQQNLILDLGNGKSLRILKVPNRFKITRKSILSFLNGYHALKKEGVPVPTVYTVESSPTGRYAVVQNVKAEFTAEEYILSRTRRPPETVKQLDRKLLEFARKTQAFHEIDDFHLGQLAWDGSQWILLDWHSNHRANASALFGSETTFSLLLSQYRHMDKERGPGQKIKLGDIFQEDLDRLSWAALKERRRCALKKKLSRFNILGD